MTTRIPRPGQGPQTQLPPAQQRGLIRGVPLEISQSFPRVWRFLAMTFLSLFALLSLLGLFWQRHPGAILYALAWSLVLSFLLFIPYYFLSPWLSPKARLRLRDELLTFDESASSWTMALKDPFCSILFYRQDREDGLLVLQRQDREVRFLYGRFRMSASLPPDAIPTTHLGFSLAQLALDQLGAYLLPDREIEYLPTLANLLQHADGSCPNTFLLPLAQHTAQSIRLDPQHLVWREAGDLQRKIPYHQLHIQPFAYHTQNPDAMHLVLHIETYQTHEGDNAAPSLWIAVDWPHSLQLSHLPHASKRHTQDALILPCIDTLLLLHILNQKGAFPAPFSLLQIHPDTLPPDA